MNSWWINELYDTEKWRIRLFVESKLMSSSTSKLLVYVESTLMNSLTSKFLVYVESKLMNSLTSLACRILSIFLQHAWCFDYNCNSKEHNFTDSPKVEFLFLGEKSKLNLLPGSNSLSLFPETFFFLENFVFICGRGLPLTFCTYATFWVQFTGSQVVFNCKTTSRKQVFRRDFFKVFLTTNLRYGLIASHLKCYLNTHARTHPSIHPSIYMEINYLRENLGKGNVDMIDIEQMIREDLKRILINRKSHIHNRSSG